MKSLLKNLIVTAECLGQVLSENAALMMINELSGHSPVQVDAALKNCLRTLTGRLTLAAILERLQKDDGHPDPDETWIIALAAENPSNRQATTAPVRQAFRFVKPALDFGDKFGARAGFIGRYKRLVAEARAQHKVADWQALPAPEPSEAWRQNAQPLPEVDPEKARANLAAVRNLVMQAMQGSAQQKSEAQDQRRSELRAKAQHFAQLEQEARDLKSRVAGEAMLEKADA